MSRRRSPSLIEALLTSMVRLPWWLLLGIGGGSAWWIQSALHRLSKPQMLTPGWGWIPASAIFGLFFLLALISFWRRRSRQKLLARHTTLDQLKKMTWQDFERLVGQIYRQQGFSVKEMGLGGADGGVDLLLTKGKQTILVQCKRWNSQSIGAPIVREMWGLAHHHRAQGVKIVTVGRFTAAAREFARGKPMELVDGPALVELIHSTSKRQTPMDSSPRPAKSSSLPKPPECPHCGQAMVQRVSKQNGNQFWGCSTFPKCRGTRPF